MLLLFINVVLGSVVDIKSELSIEEWTLKDQCGWPGVYCDSNSNVVGIALSGLKFKGTLRNGLFSGMPYLESLIITGFKSDSDVDGEIPKDICSGNSLKYIELSYLSISGSIPSAIFTCNHLTVLRLAKLQLSGTIPDQFTSLSLLETLELYGNKLTGSIPTSLSELSNLLYVELYDNQLTGTLPEFKSQKLRVLDVRKNSLVGSIPNSLLKLPHLEYVGLDYNHLELPAICEEIPYCRPITT